MTKTVSAMPGEERSVNETTDTASRLNDPYHTGVHGVGVPVECRRRFNMFLDESSQYDQIGMSVSTTLMALVPTLLSFAPLPMAEIRSLLYFNTELALLTAAMTLGLYNKGTSTLKKRNSLTVKELVARYIDISTLDRPSADAGMQGNISLPPVETLYPKIIVCMSNGLNQFQRAMPHSYRHKRMGKYLELTWKYLNGTGTIILRGFQYRILNSPHQMRTQLQIGKKARLHLKKFN